MLRDSYPDIHFFLIGDGPQKAHLIEKAKKMTLNNILFLNAVSKSEIPVYLLMLTFLSILSSVWKFFVWN